ncbi:serine O-acetyltransferase [Microbacterium sp. NPDC016588]
MVAQNGDKTGALAVKIFYSSKSSRRLGKLHQLVLRFVFGVELPPETTVGKGLDLPHGARGLVVHQGAVLGDYVTLHHNVTIGTRRPGGEAPTLGNNVSVGSGAAVLGSIYVGDGASIGSNSVVLIDVPAGGVAVGNPARVIRK